jgi:Tfp pilus assembly protein PilO
MLINHLAKLSNSVRNATAASLIFIAAVAMYKWTIVPQCGYLSSAKAYEFVMNRVTQHNKAIISQVEAKRKELQELNESSSQLNNTLFTDTQAKEFFSDLQVVSETANCIVQSTNFINEKARPEDEDVGIETKSANISVVGVYQDIEKLIGSLQTGTQKVWIDSIRMRTLDRSSDNVMCDLTVTICLIRERQDL